MIVKVNKTIFKSIWQRPLKSLEDTDLWGIGRHNLTLSQCPGNKCSREVRHTFEGCFYFSFFPISNTPGIGRPELHPVPLGHGRAWAIGHGPGWALRLSSVSAPQTQSGSCSWVDRRGDPQCLSWPPSHKAQIPLMAPDLTGSDCRCQSLLSEL